MFGELSVAIPLAIVCVIGSAFCSGTEVALFSLRRTEREQLGKSDRFVDHRIVSILERPRRLIATVLIGSEVFNSVLAVLALSVVIHASVTAFEGQLSLWSIGGITLAVTLPTTVLIAEVTAKTLAAKAPLMWSRACVLPLSLLALLITPLRIIVQFASSVVLAPLGEAARTRPARDLSEEEFRTLVDAGSAQGQVDARERRLIHRVFEFSDKNVGQVMTPRDRIFALSYDLPMQRLVKELASRGFSRVPIYQKSLDNVRGVLNAKDLMRIAAGQPHGRPLGDLLHEPLFVPRTTPVKRLFLTFKQKKVHLAVVVSEYGKVLGIVTMDDLLAQIFGQFRDERAELQSTPTRARTRTPGPGVAVVRAVSEVTGPAPRFEDDERDHDHDDRDRSVPVTKLDGSDLSAPIERLADVGADPGADAPRVAPVHPVEEATPPAVDVDELRTQGKPS